MSTITLRNIRLREVTEITEGLFSGRDDQGHLRLFDKEIFRGYATPWATPKKPNGWQVQVWNAKESTERETFTRRRLSKKGAERILIREGLRLHGAGTELA